MGKAFIPAVGLLLLVACGPASTRTATQVIGPGGGSVALGEATLLVPPGAVSTDTSFTITEIDDLPPPGYEAYSHLYRFEPRGHVFATPATVSFRFVGSAARVQVLWTALGARTWEELGGSVTGGVVAAPITHFSDGFAGAPFDVDAPSLDDGGAPFDGGVELDGGALDGGALDGGTHDADLDAAPFECTRTAPPDDPQLTACTTVTSCATGFEHSIGQFVVTETSQLTTWRSLSAGRIARVGFGLGCAEPSSACAYSAGLLDSWRIEPGTYFFDSCGGMTWVVEPPPAPPPNTSCATAMSLNAPLPGRIATRDPLYYYYDWFRDPDGYDRFANVGSSLREDRVAFSVRTVCDDPATELVGGDVSAYDMGAGTPVELANFDALHATTPVARYYVVITPSAGSPLQTALGLRLP